MTTIDTAVAKKHWGDETKYLETIQFVALSSDSKNISLIIDEEGNDEVILTPKAARYVAEKLITLSQLAKEE